MPATYATKANLLALNSDLTDNAVLQHCVDVAAASLRAGVWGDELYIGHLTLAMHLAVCQQTPSAAGGPVVSRTIDKISESYSASAISDAELGQTSWGRHHLMLRRNLASKVPYGTGGEAADWSLPDGRVH